METLVLVVAAATASMAIGVPIGIWAAHNERVYRVLQPILDLMQTLPTFVYLIPVLILFGLGVAPGLIVTVIFACPAPIRLTYLGITSVPKPMLEAGEAFGATKRQLLWKVELPAALPTIMAGLTQCIMLCLSMVGDRSADRRKRSRHVRSCARSIRCRYSAGPRGRACDRRACHHPRPHGPHRTGRPQMSVAVEFKDVDIIFGKEQAQAVAHGRCGR
jgi:ABC-type uncharacterized transport system permease subunit